MNEDLFRLVMDTLTAHLTAADLPFQADDGDLLFSGHRLGVAIAFDGFSPQGTQTLAPLDVQIHLDGDVGDRFRMGTIGVGDDRLSAMRAAVEEWHLLAASPLLAALGAEAGGRRRQKTPRMLAGWDMFPGRAGIRGTLPAGLDPSGIFYRLLLESLYKTVARWPKPEKQAIRSIFFMATTAEGEPQVQAAIDGFVDETLTGELLMLPWPRPEDAYLFKQLLVLRCGASGC